MYPSAPQQAYDRTITVFSPDGRLFQVEYAKEAVKRGAIAIGITTKTSTALVAYKNVQSGLIIPESVKKIFKIDDDAIITASGLIADARRLIDHARVYAQQQKMTYEELPNAEMIGRELADLMQVYTQYGGIRPFGVSILLTRYSPKTGSQLYEVEPSGAMTAFKADSIGAGKKEADKMLENGYSEKMSLRDALKLGIKVVKKVTNSKLGNNNLEISYVDKDGTHFLNHDQASKM